MHVYVSTISTPRSVRSGCILDQLLHRIVLHRAVLPSSVPKTWSNAAEGFFPPSLASPYETKSKKDRLCALPPPCLPSHFYFPIFATQSLPVEVENLK